MGKELKWKEPGLFLILKNCLFIPDLSHKLLSDSQLTRDLDCTVLMKPDCCIVQDGQTGQTMGVVLREVDCTTWKRRFKKANQFLFTSQRKDNCGHDIVALDIHL